MNIRLKNYIFLLMFVLFFLLPETGRAENPQETARTENQADIDVLLKKAKELEKKFAFDESYACYMRVKQLFLKAGDTAKARMNEVYAQRLMMIVDADYPYSESEAIEILKKTFPAVPADRLKKTLRSGEIPFIMRDSKPRYFGRLIDNLGFRHKEFRTPAFIKIQQSIMEPFENIIFKNTGGGNAWQPYSVPVEYSYTGKLDIARSKLPAQGLMRIWIPIPILDAAQPDVRIISVEPAQYVTYPARFDSTLGSVCYEIPLEALKNDLKINVNIKFDHYCQSFEIDPSKIGEYDQRSPVYVKNTASGGNLQITSGIKQRAEQIVSKEKNPYRAAKKIYTYMLSNIAYGFMPHFTLNAAGMPESIYVHENGYGDCGAQSVYFSALCRSIGIPARISGGKLVQPKFTEDHFWAEIYLPNYGWVPVDTSMAQTAGYIPDVSPEKRKQFEDYFFGQQDPFRMIMQNEVDAQPVPRPQFPVIFKMVMQFPFVECMECDEDLDLVTYEGWDIDVHPVK